MDTKLAKPISTCARCRAKKIKCDGEQPCGPCSRARIEVDCNYTVVPNLSHGPELRKGAACTACRRKKKKCSGDWPCRTCVASKKEDECKFNDNSQMSFTRALIERTLELEQLLAQAKTAPQPESTYPQGTSVQLDEMFAAHSPPPPTSRMYFDARNISTPSAVGPPPVYMADDSELDYSYQAISPSTSLPPASETLEEKMLRLRKKFLAKRLQFGFVLPAHKFQAIVHGDLSGTVVHPVLVHLCHLWGAMLDYCETHQTWTYATDRNGDEVMHMRLVLGGIEGMLGPPPDLSTRVLVHLSLSLYFFHKQDFQRGQEFLSIAGQAALENDMDLAVLNSTPINDGNSGSGMYSLLPITEADELRSVFSKLIWVGLSSKIVIGTPYDIDQRLVSSFERLLPSKLPNNADINFQRAKSNLLLRRTRQLTTSWSNSQATPTAWFDEYWRLIEQLHGYLGFLNPVQIRVSFMPESHTTDIVLKLCLTMALTSLADLYGVFAPNHPESSSRYRDAVLEIVSISSTFTLEDCYHLDPILPVCWAVATKRILDNTVVYENQQSLIEAIRSCNQNLVRYVPLVADFEANLHIR
ncbi:hypothetical protein MIND_00993500 [Mycena indigotica]|uniref:Zn(2)-C6 fungal-type domain-containing protein n=1 Tax=Mycena indigotica TaxID=2126181 RepID=A0A8H6S9B3_9AGAR|nr:uncharacterized protein MIND_00993500 [Mycena indigotica]KAF7294570.1 hypothetical protein MIND_00993500 [Mycena indigotica]